MERSATEIARMDRAIRLQTWVVVGDFVFGGVGAVFALTQQVSPWSALMFLTLGAVGLVGIRRMRRDRDDPAGIERRAQRDESAVIASVGLLGLASLVAVFALVGFAVVWAITR